jgi:hypothetical protein
MSPSRVGSPKAWLGPGGNVTGVTNLGGELSEKLLSWLPELIPNLSKVAVLSDSSRTDQTGSSDTST